jgi:hypothetical protein
MVVMMLVVMMVVIMGMIVFVMMIHGRSPPFFWIIAEKKADCKPTRGIFAENVLTQRKISVIMNH